MRIGMGQPRWAVAPVAAGLVLVMLLGAIGAGLRIPGLAVLGGLPRLGVLDYRTLSGGGFLPLRADYLDHLLGTGFGAEDAASAGGQPASQLVGGAGAPAADAAAAVVTAAGAAAVPAVLDHELTNDDMHNAIVITRLPFAARTDSRAATREAGEPSSCSQTGGTAWYRYTATRDGLLLANTFGSDHATSVGVFTGTRSTELEQVACATGATGNAQAAFSAERGSSYLFQLTGVVGGGRLVFNLAAAGETTTVSAAAGGRGVAEDAGRAVLSGDGQVVVYGTTGAHEGICCPHVHATDRRSGRTDLVSKSSSGEPGNDHSMPLSTSADGRYVLFVSAASNLVDDDTNDAMDLFVHDRRTSQTSRVSVGSDGEQGMDPPYLGLLPRFLAGALSADGRFVSFSTAHGWLVEDDPPGTWDLFVRDLRTGVTTRESVDEAGNPGRPGLTYDTEIAAGGRYVAFLSNKTDLAPGRYGDCSEARSEAAGRSPCLNLFLRDRLQGTTRLVSVNRQGYADMAVNRFDMSDDGRVLAWTTTTALDPDDTNGVSDVYVAGRSPGPPRRASLSSSGEQQNDPGGGARHSDHVGVRPPMARRVAVSGDGTRVAFDSYSTNLVHEDRNGASDVFLRDLRSGSTTRVSVSSSGAEGNADSVDAALDYDGSVIAFESDATNLAQNDTNRLRDVFVHDLRGL